MKILRVISNSLQVLPFLLVFSTVFIVNRELANGVVTGKYFWFYASMGVVCVVMLVFSLFRRPFFRFSLLDLLFLLFVGSIFFSSFVINDASQNTIKVTLFVLLAVLYFNFRLLKKHTLNSSSLTLNSEKIICFFIIITGLIEAVWGLRQLYGFIGSHHSLYKLTGSFFNPGPYAGYLAVVFPLALLYLIRNWELGIKSEFSIRNFQLGLGKLKGIRNGGVIRNEELGIRNKEERHQWFLILKPLFSWVNVMVVPVVASVTCIVILLVLPAAMSRASWLAIIAGSSVVLAAHYWKELKVKSYKLRQLWIKIKKKKLFLILNSSFLIIVLFSVFTGMYFMKKDSADGRALMWKMSSQAAIKHPLGAGLGNFSSAYGEAQAAYFAAGKGTKTEELVAGTPDSGFNEYLQIAVEGGVISLLLFFVLIFFSLRALIRSRKWGIAGSMVSLLVFAFFSYPFNVLPFLIVFVFMLAASSKLRITNWKLEIEDTEEINYKSTKRKSFLIPNSKFLIIFQFLIVLITAFCLYKEYPVYGAYKKWNKDKFLYTAGLHNDVVKNYEELYPLLNDQIQFLFEYAQSLSKTERYTESNEVLKRAMQISCDPMLYNIMGKNYQSLKEYKLAEDCFIKATFIVPHRLYPFYLLTLLYHEMGLQDKVNEMADIVQTKEPKVQSTAVREMRQEVNKLKVKN